jgi:hypothetical protein
MKKRKPVPAPQVVTASFPNKLDTFVDYDEKAGTLSVRILLRK